MKLKVLFASFVMIFFVSFVSCSKKSSSNHDEQGLEFVLQQDNTYSVSAGTSNSLSNIVIPELFNNRPVTKIAENGFYHHQAKTITIANGITSIGDYAFSDCRSLTSIVIPNSVTSIGDMVFFYCTSLTSIVIPDSVTFLSACAFYNCTSLTSITLPNSINSIYDQAFYNCTSLTSITIPNSVISIGENVFAFCTSLTSIVIPDSVTSIGNNAFSDCYNFKEVFYTGTVLSWRDIDINYGNTYLTNATRYYYSKTRPTDMTYKYWHYVNGVPTPWEN